MRIHICIEPDESRSYIHKYSFFDPRYLFVFPQSHKREETGLFW
jgi:hypothetical protein